MSTSAYYLQSAEQLVNEELHVLVGKPLKLDDVVEVCSHQVRHQVAADSREDVQAGGGGESGHAAMATIAHLCRASCP